MAITKCIIPDCTFVSELSDELYVPNKCSLNFKVCVEHAAQYEKDFKVHINKLTGNKAFLNSTIGVNEFNTNTLVDFIVNYINTEHIKGRKESSATLASGNKHNPTVGYTPLEIYYVMYNHDIERLRKQLEDHICKRANNHQPSLFLKWIRYSTHEYNGKKFKFNNPEIYHLVYILEEEFGFHGNNSYSSIKIHNTKTYDILVPLDQLDICPICTRGYRHKNNMSNSPEVLEELEQMEKE